MTISVYLDTNVFISAFETLGERSDAMLRIFDAVGADEFTGVVSELTPAEVLPKPLSLGQQDVVALYTNLLSGDASIRVAPVTRTVLIETAHLRSRHPTLKLPDAVHSATAKLETCGAIVSGDRRLPFLAGMLAIRLGPASRDDLRGGA